MTPEEKKKVAFWTVPPALVLAVVLGIVMAVRRQQQQVSLGGLIAVFLIAFFSHCKAIVPPSLSGEFKCCSK
jgi:ABC-type dipeptide/oligopeptide/nickel transport system permease component